MNSRLPKPIETISIINQTESSTKSRINSKKTNLGSRFFQPLSSYEPHLPLAVYHRPASLSENRIRLILLATRFFQNRHWFYESIAQNSETFTTSLYCPLLENFCNVTNDLNKLSEADALVFHGRNYFNRSYFDERRRPEQRTVFALWESPKHSCDLRNYKGFFNWTMTYRLDSDIVTTYASSSPYIHTSNPYFQMIRNDVRSKGIQVPVSIAEDILSQETLAKKIGTAAILLSNCHQTDRTVYIENLSKFVDVQIFGACGQRCPDDVDCRQYIAERYYFYLSFENSLCTDYVSEKLFLMIKYPIVPVVMGRANYSVFLPSSGYINVEDFSNELALGNFLKNIRDDKEKYRTYFRWKEGYFWLSMNYFFSFCDLCVRLHIDKTTSIVDDIHGWWFNDVCIFRNKSLDSSSDDFLCDKIKKKFD